MTYVDASVFRENLSELLEETIRHDEPLTISAEDGNAVLLSERDYNGLIETLYFYSIHGMEERIVDGINTPIDECIPEDIVAW